VARTGSKLCRIMGFGISCVELLGSATKQLVSK
jgi:hypothetical protein